MPEANVGSRRGDQGGGRGRGGAEPAIERHDPIEDRVASLGGIPFLLLRQVITPPRHA